MSTPDAFHWSSWADALEVAGEQAWPVGLKTKDERRVNRYFRKEETAMANKEMKICLTLLVIREMEIKASEVPPCIYHNVNN